ncbi:MAG TPA: F0F1 ATP synthase subunit B [Bacteroidia bacterium]|jgi:F-type H+-transporting ATPase subunit b|nr:F0F1 ATP synthase subunit B [Bacteroidia bacterium]
MELVTPAIGLIFWMLVTFAIIFFILKKFAWKPILNMIKEREQGIEKALKSADDALETMRELKAGNEKILHDARNERDNMLKEARDTKEAIIAEAKTKAKQEADRLVAQARETINAEKMAAIAELKNQVAALSIDIAEKILKEHLSSDDKQKTLVNNLVKEVTLN